VQTINLKLDVFDKFNQAKRIEQYEEKEYLTNSEFINIMIDFMFKDIKVNPKSLPKKPKST
tara:strand:- start:83 stop:265 length:183 start_codon:yes stop_codon:yes gene_type:complete